jgi:hypothetical protein
MAHSVVAMSAMVDPTEKAAGAVPADGFSLSRWSRLKRAGGDAAATGAAPGDAPAEVKPSASAPTSGGAALPDAASTPLPSLSSISLAEDFTPFMQAKVPQALRQQALKALFKEPHFNVMDGLDTYIDDYTQFEPISPEVMSTLSSWKTIMNPPRQVVTPGGYAVDAESDEGRAALVANEASGADDGKPIDESNADAAAAHDAISADERPPPAPVHSRYGKRVGDFAAMDMTDSDALTLPDADPAMAPTDATTIPEKDA